MTRPEVHLIGGTSAETVTLAPVVTAMQATGLLEPVIVASGQHPAAVHRGLAAFGHTPDVSLSAAPGGGSAAELLTGLLRGLDAHLGRRTPAAVVVRGDTTTSLAAALAAYWRGIPVVHLEAGLRAGHLESGFPDEANRRLVAQITHAHLAPTPLAAMNLLDEGVAMEDVVITGSTVVDAALAVAGRKLPYENSTVAVTRAASHGRRLVLVVAHRRESSGAPLDRMLNAVRALVRRYPDVEVLCPGHPGPAARRQQDAALVGVERVTVTDPLPYPDMARLLSEAYLVLTDSDAVLQEAPSFGVPALVLRETTERTEALHAGNARLVGSDTDLIVREASLLLDDRRRRDAMTAAGNPYGDGLAGARAAQATAALLGLADMPAPMPATDAAAATPGAHV